MSVIPANASGLVGVTRATSSGPLRAGAVLGAEEFGALRRRMVLEGCKWDPQVGDVGTIADFPLIMSGAVWREIAGLASLLTAELLEAEEELLKRPELLGRLGLGRRLRSVLGAAGKLGPTVSAGRVMRFDFHWTRDGWAISEVNSDVPGGYTEGSELPALMERHYARTRAAGNPGGAWVDAIAATAIPGRAVGLLAAAGHIEDQQVIAYLEGRLRERGVRTRWIGPRDLVWRDREAHVIGATGLEPLGAIVRFYQAEWLDVRQNRGLFVGGRTPVGNSGAAAVTESKRWPLVWDALRTELPTWRRLLPETRDPRDAPWRKDDGWMLKSAMCNTGDTVMIRSLMEKKAWDRASWGVRLRPGAWVAQRRFEAMAVETDRGSVYPCVGVYTVNGQPAGMYGRISPRPLIDYAAVDVAILVEEGGGSFT